MACRLSVYRGPIQAFSLHARIPLYTPYSLSYPFLTTPIIICVRCTFVAGLSSARDVHPPSRLYPLSRPPHIVFISLERSTYFARFQVGSASQSQRTCHHVVSRCSSQQFLTILRCCQCYYNPGASRPRLRYVIILDNSAGKQSVFHGVVSQWHCLFLFEGNREREAGRRDRESERLRRRERLYMCDCLFYFVLHLFKIKNTPAC